MGSAKKTLEHHFQAVGQTQLHRGASVSHLSHVDSILLLIGTDTGTHSRGYSFRKSAEYLQCRTFFIEIGKQVEEES